jgi:hypothetical protein
VTVVSGAATTNVDAALVQGGDRQQDHRYGDSNPSGGRRGLGILRSVVDPCRQEGRRRTRESRLSGDLSRNARGLYNSKNGRRSVVGASGRGSLLVQRILQVWTARRRRRSMSRGVRRVSSSFSI